MWKNKPLSRYLNLIGKALVLKSERPEIFGGYHFALLDSAEANALSAPGGIIFISRGIVDMAENEDELAAILAHEIQHIVSKDPLKAIKSQRMKSLGTFAAGEAMGSGSEVLEYLQGFGPGYHRHAAAERLFAQPGKGRRPGGAGPAGTRAGYNPTALLTMLEKCRRDREKEGQGFLGPSIRGQAHRLRGRRPGKNTRRRHERPQRPLQKKRFPVNLAPLSCCRPR